MATLQYYEMLAGRVRRRRWRPSYAEYVPKPAAKTLSQLNRCRSAAYRQQLALSLTRRLLSLSLHMRAAELRHSDRSGIPGCALARPLRSGVSQRQRAPRRPSSQAGLQPPESRVAERAWLRRLPWSNGWPALTALNVRCGYGCRRSHLRT